MKGFRIARSTVPVILALAAAGVFAWSSGPSVASPAPEGSGKVLETMDADIYTYLKVAFPDQEAWIAAPKVPVAVGDEVQVPAGLLMKDFRSETLDREFPEIYFVQGVTKPGMSEPGGQTVPGGGQLPVGHPPMEEPKKGEAHNMSWDLADIEKIEGGLTVAEVWNDRDQHVGQEIAVRGRVVKYLTQILGKNWLHIRDGSGAEGTNDLTITTSAELKEGDLVQIRGILVADRDFGMGYRYDLIVEDAAVTVE